MNAVSECIEGLPDSPAPAPSIGYANPRCGAGSGAAQRRLAQRLEASVMPDSGREDLGRD
jgi:hypothetical protein